MTCEHNYQYQGIVYADEDTPMSGTGACRRYYEDVYFCTKCLQLEYKNRKYHGNSYYKPEFGATPK